MKEEWKDMKGFEGVYKISTFGNIKTVERTIKYDMNLGIGKKTPRKLKSKIRKQKFNKNTGYMMIGLNANAKNKCYTVHSLMAETFLEYKRGQGRSIKSNSVNHKDGNKLNNNITNLEVISLGDNVRHMFKTGLSTTNHRLFFENVEYYSKAEFRRVTGISWKKMNEMIISGEITLF